ncbi:MAG: hypothetical protein K9L17_11155 [Clostridiales bacterium]|nr:hypothetical protein [Clostridiales bacterium]MCF8023240.1 hypothetical protein [Clostridiales bacterium]
MSWIKNLMLHTPNKEIEKEQLFYQLRDAQNASMEMGEYISQLTQSTIDPGQLQHLEQLNTRVGLFLHRLQQHVEDEI